MRKIDPIIFSEENRSKIKDYFSKFAITWRFIEYTDNSVIVLVGDKGELEYIFRSEETVPLFSFTVKKNGEPLCDGKLLSSNFYYSLKFFDDFEEKMTELIGKNPLQGYDKLKTTFSKLEYDIVNKRQAKDTDSTSKDSAKESTTSKDKK